MPTSEPCRARAARGTIASLSLALALGLSGSGAGAQSGDGLGEMFYSFVPGQGLTGTMPEGSRDGRARSVSDTMRKAARAYRTGDYAKAYRHYAAAAEDGELLAHWFLGHLYRNGLGIGADPLRALHHYETVVRDYSPGWQDEDLRHAVVDSTVRVADVYMSGLPEAGIAADPARAMDLYNSAAQAGHSRAQYAMGLIYLHGQGVKQSNKRAVRWLNLAAQKRYAPAAVMLGEIFWTFNADRSNRVRALKWLIVGAETASRHERAAIEPRASQLAQQMTPDETDQARLDAFTWSSGYPPRGATLADPD